MFYSSELHFICDVFKKSRISVHLTSLDDPLNKVLDENLLSILDNPKINNMPLSEFTGKINSNTLYKNTDLFNISYIYFLLPEMPQETVIFIGPFITNTVTQADFLKICEKAKIFPKNQSVFGKFYFGIPIISKSSHLLVMLDTFCEKIWGADNFTLYDVAQERISPISPITAENNSESDLDQTLASINLMEQRYNYENKLIEAVKLGQIHKADLLFSGIEEISFEKRAQDPLRNMKNYCIIMNTLFRKAAENGGVMPIYIDKVSSDFAIQIEQISNVSDIKRLMKDIFSSYCRLVRKHTMKSYSPIVQKTIIFIESDISANLTLETLAKAHNVSGGYLSTVFKKETGKNVTEYIRDKRMKHAEHLLSTTHLQIQTVALHCGIMDVQYFSKLFKKHTGKTPKEYRDTIKNPPL